MKGTRHGLWQRNLAIYLSFRQKAIAKILGTMISSCINSVIRSRGSFAVSKDFAAFLPAMINLTLSFWLLSTLLSLSMLLCEHTLEFAQDNLFSPLKISVEKNVYFRNKEEQFDFYKSKGINGWVADPNGTNTAGWGLSLTTMDMAKLGLLYLNKGLLYNRQIVSEKWVSESTQVQSIWETRNLKYGYLWWIIGEEDCSFAALGDGGNAIYVNAKDKIVVAISSLFVPRVKDRVDFIKNDIEPIFKFN